MTPKELLELVKKAEELGVKTEKRGRPRKIRQTKEPNPSDNKGVKIESRPFSLIAVQYCRDVIAGKIPSSKHCVLACKRHIADLEKSESDEYPFIYDETKGDRVCRFIELLPHVKGEWAARQADGKQPTVKLEPAQVFIICSLFGWVKKSNGKRRFKTASIYMPRKNGKSTLAAGIGWWMFAKDGEPGAEVYSGATTQEQALEVFRPAWQMARMVPALREGLGVTLTGKTDPGPMLIMGSNSKFAPVIGKPGDGASPHCAIVDEYHEHLDSTLYDTMKTGMGARSQPLLLIISTAGENISGPCRNDWVNSEKLLEGIPGYENETHFAIIWSVDDGDDWTTEKALEKANPLWRVSVNPEIYIPDQKAAMQDATKQNIFKIKHLNKWVNAASGWMNMEHWKECGDESLSLDDFAGRKAWVSLDAASRLDFTSLTITFKRRESEGGGFVVFAKHYLPEDTINRPENKTYRDFMAKGFLTATAGARVDFTVIEKQLKEWSETFSIQAFGYDPNELNDFVNRVSLWAYFDIIEIRQSAGSLSDPMKELEAHVASRTYRHNGDEVLAWMMSNVVKKEARGGGPVKFYYPTKARAVNKIDGAVAAIMGLKIAQSSLECDEFESADNLGFVV